MAAVVDMAGHMDEMLRPYEISRIRLRRADVIGENAFADIMPAKVDLLSKMVRDAWAGVDFGTHEIRVIGYGGYVALWAYPEGPRVPIQKGAWIWTFSKHTRCGVEDATAELVTALVDDYLD